jgi:DNA mismatch endonuclease, patch repair protein
MVDFLTRSQRSERMSRIRSRGNKDTELALARLLRANQITGWRRQTTLVVRSSRRKEAQTENRQSKTGNRKIIGASSPRLLRVKVDFVFRQVRLAVFVDGCFWHSCPKHGTQPAGNRSFWKKKFARNIARDRLVNRTLRRAGWRVLRIWEHELAHKNEARLLRRIQRTLI